MDEENSARLNELKYFKEFYSSKTNSKTSNTDESLKALKLKKHADKAFNESKFEKAYKLYTEALIYDQNDYDIIACLIGAALNLGYINEVLEKSDLLIKLDEQKAQGYYLKGVANHVIFQYESAIDLFLKALEFERDHAALILKNLIKTISKYLDVEDTFQFDDSNNNEITNLLKLIEITELLIKRRKFQIVVKILNFVQNLESDNYHVKTEFLMMSGKLFKMEGNQEKALLAYEECFYLASINNDNKIKIKTIVSISSCYLDANDWHKAIFYYHKLIDIEFSLLNNNSTRESPEDQLEIINLELRIAIRQNLFTAHFRLGKLRICVFYLNEIIQIIDNQLKLNDPQNFSILSNGNLLDSFEFIQIKMDATVELIKLYILFKEFLQMEKLLNSMLQFVENVVEKGEAENSLSIKQSNSLRYFKIKCYSYFGICLAGLRDYRFSKLCTRKSLCLIDREIEIQKNNQQQQGVSDEESILTSDSQIFSGSNNNIRLLTLLKVECLSDATEACVQYKKAFKELKNFNDSYYSEDNLDNFDLDEIESLKEIYEQQIDYAKNAYILSKTLIDPTLRSQTAFNLAYSLYENEFYQSAAYYFNEVLAIPKTLLESSKSDNSQFYTDVNPDYHMESIVYLCKCQLMFDYYQVDSLVKSNLDKDEFDLVFIDSTGNKIINKIESIELEVLEKKLIKQNQIIIKHILNWKLHETNRASFLFNLELLDKIKADKDSLRLRDLLETCNECLIYINYKMGKYKECYTYMEQYNYLLNVDLANLADHSENKFETETDFINYFNNFENIDLLLKSITQKVLRYKFIFDCKLLYIFLIEPNLKDDTTASNITFVTQQKMTLILNEHFREILGNHKQIDSQFDFLFKKFEKVQNDWIRKNLSSIECRDVPTDDIELRRLREKNRIKEKNFFNYMNNNEQNLKTKFCVELVINGADIIKLKLSEKLRENRLNSNNQIAHQEKFHKITFNKELNLHIEFIFGEIFLKPIEPIFNQLSETFNLLIDSQYSKAFIYTFNLFNQSSSIKLPYLITFDSFFQYSNRILISLRKDIDEMKQLDQVRQEILNQPNRNKKISDKPNETNSSRVPKTEIIPRYTSHPRLAVKVLNEYPDKDFVILKNDHVQRAKNRLDASVSVLISKTISGTDSKRSNLEVLNYKQINKIDKCSVIGCPELPDKMVSSSKFKINLQNGFEQMRILADLLYTEPIFSNKMTKTELINQLESSTVVFLSTFSTNESDSILICSETKEYPSSPDEIDKYCRFDVHDLDQIDMYHCNLLILNCYSTIYNKPRLNLAKKFLARGCKSVLIVLSPLTDDLMTVFYSEFFDNLKRYQPISVAYQNSVSKIASVFNNSPDHESIFRMIHSSFCLIGTLNIHLSIKEIAQSMIQAKVDKSLDAINLNDNINYLNLESKYASLISNFSTHLEKTLHQLQILIKFLLNHLIEDSIKLNSFKKNSNFNFLFFMLNDLIGKSIFYIKTKKILPEQVNELIDQNKNAVNLLKCLGFNIQDNSISRIRDEKVKKFILFPDHRHLDLNLRLSHVMSSLIELCFDKPQTITNENFNDSNEEIYNSSNYLNLTDPTGENINLRIKCIVYNLQALLPIENKLLLACIIDIIALTKFSPEIALSLTDYSIFYALNFYQNQSKLSNQSFVQLIDKDIEKWNYSKNLNDSSPPIDLLPATDKRVKFSINNKVLNFLISIGFEIIGTWLRFNDIEFNRKIIDLMIKFFTSFALDRDMSLYKELNINVLGQRSPAPHSFNRASSNLQSNYLQKNNSDEIKIPTPWCSVAETKNKMEKKIQFIEKYLDLSAKISKERKDTLKHHLNYINRQHAINLKEASSEEQKLLRQRSNLEMKLTNDVNNNNNNHAHLVEKIKYKAGGGPAKDREIVNEKYNVNIEKIQEIRNQSHSFCQKNLAKIDVERQEKLQNLMLPLLKN